jgi:hypothetical protein
MSRDVKALAVLIPYAVLVHPFNQFPADGKQQYAWGMPRNQSPTLFSSSTSFATCSDAHNLGRGIKRWASTTYQGERGVSGTRSSGSHRLKVRLAATPMPARCFPIPPFSVPRVCSLRGPEHSGCGCGCETIPPSRHNRRGRLGTTVSNPEPHQ